MAEENGKKKKESIYHLDIKPGKEVRVLQWNLIITSDIPVGVDFYHTDLLERVIAMTGVKSQKEEQGEVEG